MAPSFRLAATRNSIFFLPRPLMLCPPRSLLISHIHLMIHIVLVCIPHSEIAVYRICAPYRSLSQLITSFLGLPAPRHPIDELTIQFSRCSHEVLIQVLFTIVFKIYFSLNKQSGLKSLPNLNLLLEDSIVSRFCLSICLHLHLVCHSHFHINASHV